MNTETVQVVACSYCRREAEVDTSTIDSYDLPGWTWFCSPECEQDWNTVPEAQQVTCWVCDQRVNTQDVALVRKDQLYLPGFPEPQVEPARVNIYEVYDSPFDTEPSTVAVCGEACDEVFWTTDYDFAYWECDECQRLVCQRNPSNGWHEHFRFTEDGDQICLLCYQDAILANGHPRAAFERGSIPGMFFSGDDREPLGAGYEKATTEFIRGGDAAQAFCEQALRYIDDGYQVVVGYESMAIGGLEGTVSLFVKKAGPTTGGEQA